MLPIHFFKLQLFPLTFGPTKLIPLNHDISVGIYYHGGIISLKYITTLAYTVLCVEKSPLLSVGYYVGATTEPKFSPPYVFASSRKSSSIKSWAWSRLGVSYLNSSDGRMCVGGAKDAAVTSV